ncbi:UDP-glucose 4-epimerase GalE [Idiomarina sp. PL1-037]|uniref:UDP-glucose 4-epimerase GalE n=1 Tax=Idiomarina sp. PL1-037 TaxID=3095365 RepID=UPI002ACC19A6|nr:UDP-glucose 4-epimerase GalE [Idiomarina sp. PL1-037]WQC53497.1 UDP-glucose 4-epimerase GalE [Idiomarina sp. PL1-037]
MRVLVTGGMGYIGSHTCIQLLNAGHDPIIVDNLSNSKPLVLDRIQKITGRRPGFVLGDVCDKRFLINVLQEHKVESVIHFAGVKSVGESNSLPIKYYENNFIGSLRLIEAMQSANVTSLVFSSSATVYGDPASVPIKESFPIQPTNPYGRSKSMVEQFLQDFQHANSDWSITLLRYFNPIGAHDSGLVGEDPNGEPSNLVPYIAQVAFGKRYSLGIFGNDYDTPDGTGIRDYVHVVDLADGHLAALNKTINTPGTHVFNLGTGRGHSVLEILRAFEEHSKLKIPYSIKPRRQGDIAKCWANVADAHKILQWKATRSLATMIKDTWNWQVMNPNGYDS